MDGRVEELGRPLDETEVAAVLEQHGRPVIVAARYLPQHFLIGPGLFPLYWFTLLKSFPLVALAYAAVQMANFIFGGGTNIGAAIGHFPYVAFTFWGVVTLGFAVFEFAQGRYFAQVKFAKEWNPSELPALTQQKGPSFANRVADLIVNALIFLWVPCGADAPISGVGTGGFCTRTTVRALARVAYLLFADRRSAGADVGVEVRRSLYELGKLAQGSRAGNTSGFDSDPGRDGAGANVLCAVADR
jgi:hypothetical protein